MFQDPLTPSDQGFMNFARNIDVLRSEVRRGKIDQALVLSVIDKASRLVTLGRLEYAPGVNDYQRIYEFVVARYRAEDGRQGVALAEVADEFTSGNFYVAKGLLDALSNRGLLLTLDRLSPGSKQLWYPLHFAPKDS